jgi:hypothetical protein
LWVIAPVQATDCDSYLFCHRVTDMSFRNNSISRAAMAGDILYR